jgi:CBS domain-containing protein
MPYYIPETLQKIAEQVYQNEHPTVTVRMLLSWFGAQRRRNLTVRTIREALDELKLKTDPEIEAAYIDGLVKFLPISKSDGKAAENASHTVAIPPEADRSFVENATGGAMVGTVVDPTFRIGRLASANRRPVSVTPDATVGEAITLMLKNDFSQLPAMASERMVKGLFSWKSLGSRLSLGRICNFVREAMDNYQEVSVDTSIFSAIGLIVQHECVLVRDTTGKICGIITTNDLSVQFGQLGEPFIFLGEIENHIRSMIAGRFTKEELTTARNPTDSEREICDPSDLTLGELVRLLQEPNNWQRLGLRIDRKLFVADVEEIRRIRNEVMHFDPDGIAEDDLSKLRTFVEFLRRLHKLGPKEQ